MKNSKKIMLASLLIAAGYSTLASAHSQSGSLGASASGATDVYAVTCGAGTAKLFLQVKDLAPVVAPKVSIQATKGAASSTLSTDAVDGDAVYSPGVTVAGTPGVFTLKVNKSAVAGAETYVAQFHCQTSAGAHTDTTWAMTQNQ